MALTFAQYLAQRPRRYTAASSFLFQLMRDDEFLGITTREELDRYLDRRQIGPNGHLHAHAVWLTYLRAKKKRPRRPSKAGS